MLSPNADSEHAQLERKLLAAVLAQMPLGVMIVAAPSGRPVLHNEQLAKLVGRPVLAEGAVLLAVGGHAMHGDGRTFHASEDPLARALAGESVHAEDIVYQRGDGARAILRASAVPVRDEAGAIVAAVLTLSDVTEWKAAERQLRESETRYRLASCAINHAIWDWDLVVDRIDWSEGISACFGHPAETIQPSIGWWFEQIDPADRERVRGGFDATLGGDSDLWHDEYRFRCFDGRLADVIDRGFVVRDARGVAIRAIGAMEDVSERRRADAERSALLERERRARADAEAANRAKDEFLAVVSHELRTPLAPILGFVDILLEDQLSETDQRAALGAIERNARSLSHLIDDLLDVARITSGKLSLEYAPVHLREIVTFVVHSVRPSATAKGVAIDLHLDDVQEVVAGDATRLTQVVANLLSNAIKFTGSGGRVEVTVERRASCVVLTVQDNGKGIAVELLPYVFERFRQGDTSDTRVHGGLGLGLAIVRHIVELHGGTVHAASTGEGRGATLTVILPLMQSHDR